MQKHIVFQTRSERGHLLLFRHSRSLLSHVSLVVHPVSLPGSLLQPLVLLVLQQERLEVLLGLCLSVLLGLPQDASPFKRSGSMKLCTAARAAGSAALRV